MSPVLRGCFVLALTGSVAACPSGPPAARSPAPLAPSALPSTGAASSSATPAGAASSSAPGPVAPQLATLLSDPDGWLSDFAAGPPGVLVVAGHGKGGAFVASIDLATRKPVARVKLAATSGARTLLARDGARIYALVDDDEAKELIELGPDLSVLQRTRLAVGGGKKKPLWSDLIVAFAVVDRRAIVLPKQSAAIAYVFSSKGELLATRDCKASLFWPKYYRFALQGGRVLLSELHHEDGASGVCAFDADGKGPVDTLKVAAGQAFHVGDGGMAITGVAGEDAWSAPVDGRLKVGKKTKPPVVPEATPEDTSGRGGCPGVTGSAIRRAERVHGAKVVHTFNCCGDSGPSGVWVCP